ncbi:MAG TPA: DUF4097 family beta strand repeat-containing protein [Chloroflexota bacterium]|nr:DUF4097 family beta strand repeat-containing protein [Chloroflexota bacterium]
MAEQKYYTSSSPQVSVTRCGGDLVINTGMENAVTVAGSGFEVQEANDSLTINGDSDLKLVLPAAAGLRIEYVGGDLVIRNLTGDLSLDTVRGDVVLSGSNHAKINVIHGDISAKNGNGSLSIQTLHGDAALRRVADVALGVIHGDLSVQVVNGRVDLHESYGDVSLRSVSGDVTISQCARDVNLRNLGGRTAVQNVKGDIRLVGGLSATEHIFAASGDIIVRWPTGAPLNLSATAPQIVNRLSLDKEMEVDHTLTGRLGDGETTATFTAGGRIVLKEEQMVNARWEDENEGGFAFGFDFADLGEQIGRQVNEQIARITSNFETKFGPDYSDKMAEKAARKAEEAARKAEQAAERMRQRAERQAARNVGGYGRPAAPPPPRAKASADEQIKILKMVEQGIISPDEAATLLEALER